MRISRYAKVGGSTNVTIEVLLPYDKKVEELERLVAKEVGLLDGHLTDPPQVLNDSVVKFVARLNTYDYRYLVTNLRSLFERLGLDEYDWEITLPKRLRRKRGSTMRRYAASLREEYRELKELARQKELEADKASQEVEKVVLEAARLMAGPDSWQVQVLKDRGLVSELAFDLVPGNPRDPVFKDLRTVDELLRKAADLQDEYMSLYHEFVELDEEADALGKELARMEQSGPQALDYMELTE